MPGAQGTDYFMSLVKRAYNAGPITPQSKNIRVYEHLAPLWNWPLFIKMH